METQLERLATPPPGVEGAAVVERNCDSQGWGW
jgi:hypothetical protein